MTISETYDLPVFFRGLHRVWCCIYWGR